jgi:hypothetical protein
VFYNLGFSDDYARQRTLSLLREAEQDRLADLAAGRRTSSLRLQVAGVLFALAERLERQPASASADARLTA